MTDQPRDADTERFSVTVRANPGDRFAPDAFVAQLGKKIPVNGVDGDRREGILCDTIVAEDGASVTLTLEVLVQGKSMLGRTRPPGTTSIGFNLGSEQLMADYAGPIGRLFASHVAAGGGQFEGRRLRWAQTPSVDDILHVLDGLGERQPKAEAVGFGVAVQPDSTGSWFPFERGEVYLVDLTREVEQVSMGFEFGGEGRRPFKWDVQVEVFTTLDEAKARSVQVRS